MIKWLMQFREIMAVCSKNYMEYISDQNIKFFKVKGDCTCIHYCASKGETQRRAEVKEIVTEMGFE
jgi:hypothetical protein